MNGMTRAVLVAAMLAGCTTTAATPPPGTSTYTGEVWTWDEQLNTITLRQGVQTFRVNVSPSEFVGLQLHSTKTIRGTLAGPLEIATVVSPPPSSYSVVPKGGADEAEITGKVTGVDASGLAAIDSARGPLTVWVVAPGQSRFRQGSDVRLRVTVQPVDIVAGPAPAPPPSATVAQEPGDYAVVVGPVRNVDPSGRVRIDSPRGPVEVWVSNPGRYRPGEFVQVRTALHPSS